MKSLLKKLMAVAAITSLILSCSPEERIDSDESLIDLLEKIAADAEVNRVTTLDIVYNPNESVYQAVNIEVMPESYVPTEFALGENRLQNAPPTGKIKWKVVCTNGDETLCETPRCVGDAVAACLEDQSCVEVCPIAGISIYVIN